MKMFSKKGGIRIGQSYWIAENYTFPFARLILSERVIMIEYPFNRAAIIDRLNVIEIQKTKGLFSAGVRIVHASSEIPPYVVFWTFNANLVIASFIEMRYPVA